MLLHKTSWLRSYYYGRSLAKRNSGSITQTPGGSSKRQTPKSREDPRTKNQAPTPKAYGAGKIQASRSRGSEAGISRRDDLSPGGALDFGADQRRKPKPKIQVNGCCSCGGGRQVRP